MTISTLSVAVLLLWILVIVLSIMVFALARQIGVLHERIAPVGALMLAKGLAIGERAPDIVVSDVSGQSVSFSVPRADGKSTLLMFISPTCPVCKTLLPIIKSAQRSEQDKIEIVLASDGDLTEHVQFRIAHGLEHFRYVLSAPLGITFQIGRLPYAVLLDNQGILKARGLVNSREHLESLFEAQRLNSPTIQDYLKDAH
jgi:methylamine dehydrogenase accessory protein MauD